MESRGIINGIFALVAVQSILLFNDIAADIEEKVQVDVPEIQIRNTNSEKEHLRTSNSSRKFDNITLNVGEASIIKIGFARTTKLILSNNTKNFILQKTKNIAFWIFEVHTDSLEVTMTLKPDKNISYTSDTIHQTMGSNIGLVILNNQTTNRTTDELASVYLHNKNSCKVKGIVLVRGYTKEDPVPSLGTSKRNITGLQPHLNVTWNNQLTLLRFRPAGNLEQYLHKKPSDNTLVYKYSIYQYWFKEGKFNGDQYINTLSTMLLRADIETKGKLVEEFYQIRNATGAGMVEVRFPTFPGTPQLFAVVVSTSKETYTSAKLRGTNGYDSVDEPGEQDFHSVYIATVTAGCKLKVELPALPSLTGRNEVHRIYDEEEWATTTGCSDYYASETNVMMVLVLIVGLFVLFIGHKCFSAAQFIYGVLLIGLLAYPIFSATLLQLDHMWILICSVGAGVCGGIMTILLWQCVGSLMLSTVCPAALAGGILGCTALYICGCLQKEFLMESEFFYGILAIVVMIYVGVTITFTRYCHLFSSSILGGYLVALTLDYYVGSSIKYSLLNIIYRTFVSGYSGACTQMPFQDYEKLVVALWVSSTIFGSIFQLWSNRNQLFFQEMFTASLRNNPYRSLQEEGAHPSHQNPNLNETTGEISTHATDFNSPHSIMTEGNRTSIGYRQHLHPRNNNNNNRVSQMQVTTLDTDDHLLDNSVQVEDNTRNPAEGGEVVGYIQGFGPVTAEPNMSAAVIRVFQNPRIYEDRPIRASAPRDTASPNARQGDRLHHRFKRTLVKATQRPPRDIASEEDASGSAGVSFDGRLRRSKDIFKPPTPESSSPE